jgi:mannose-6-phosphate isomerase class I
MNGFEIGDFFDPEKLSAARDQAHRKSSGLTLIAGTGTSLIVEDPEVLIYADMVRWEIQRRYRAGKIGNLGLDNAATSASLRYKRAFFLDWRAADRLKRELFPKIDFLLDTNDAATPKMISGTDLRAALETAVRRPFRVVPFFDPGPWGGHWMEKVCDLPADGAPNHAWCFDCVPEENSLLLGLGDARIEIPAIDLVFAHPRELLGDAVFSRFGAEFPIRFDFLDTMGGGNLSLQVHPLTAYIREKFGMDYTQDESYYLLDAAANAHVYLGLKENISREEMVRDLRKAQEEEAPFPAEKYVNQFPTRKHDHFLIPAGTIHCSGKDCMVLEISATPYIFTFKLWDWGRPGLDGKPRPIHLEHGLANVQWTRTTEWVKRSLVNRVEPIASGKGWREERTGLHELEFIETRRHWFTSSVEHDTRGTVHVLNLVQGEQAVVESPNGAFEPFEVHYAETFIVPAQVGAYTVRPDGPSAGHECATVQASVRG